MSREWGCSDPWLVGIHGISLFPDGKLQEQVETLRREITRLEYQKNELETVREGSMALYR